MLPCCCCHLYWNILDSAVFAGLTQKGLHHTICSDTHLITWFQLICWLLCSAVFTGLTQKRLHHTICLDTNSITCSQLIGKLVRSAAFIGLTQKVLLYSICSDTNLIIWLHLIVEILSWAVFTSLTRRRLRYTICSDPYSIAWKSLSLAVFTGLTQKVLQFTICSDTNLISWFLLCEWQWQTSGCYIKIPVPITISTIHRACRSEPRREQRRTGQINNNRRLQIRSLRGACLVPRGHSCVPYLNCGLHLRLGYYRSLLHSIGLIFVILLFMIGLDGCPNDVCWCCWQGTWACQLGFSRASTFISLTTWLVLAVSSLYVGANVRSRRLACPTGVWSLSALCFGRGFFQRHLARCRRRGRCGACWPRCFLSARCAFGPMTLGGITLCFGFFQKVSRCPCLVADWILLRGIAFVKTFGAAAGRSNQSWALYMFCGRGTALAGTLAGHQGRDSGTVLALLVRCNGCVNTLALSTAIAVASGTTATTELSGGMALGSCSFSRLGSVAWHRPASRSRRPSACTSRPSSGNSLARRTGGRDAGLGLASGASGTWQRSAAATLVAGYGASPTTAVASGATRSGEQHARFATGLDGPGGRWLSGCTFRPTGGFYCSSLPALATCSIGKLFGALRTLWVSAFAFGLVLRVWTSWAGQELGQLWSASCSQASSYRRGSGTSRSPALTSPCRCALALAFGGRLVRWMCRDMLRGSCLRKFASMPHVAAQCCRIVAAIPLLHERPPWTFLIGCPVKRSQSIKALQTFSNTLISLHSHRRAKQQRFNNCFLILLPRGLVNTTWLQIQWIPLCFQSHRTEMTLYMMILLIAF